MATSREASTTGVPKTSSSSKLTSPRATPIRTARRRAAPRLPVDGLLDGHRARNRVGGRAEDRQDPVAEGLDLFAAVGGEGLTQVGEMLPAEVVECGFPEAATAWPSNPPGP